MTSLDLTKLREIANAATPGPWESGMTTFGDPRDGATHACVRVEDAHWTDHLAVIEGSTEGDLDMAHIAAFDPPTVLELLDEVEELRRWKAEMVQMLDGLNELAQAAEVPLGGRIIETATERIEELRAALVELAKTKENDQ